MKDWDVVVMENVKLLVEQLAEDTSGSLGRTPGSYRKGATATGLKAQMVEGLEEADLPDLQVAPLHFG